MEERIRYALVSIDNSIIWMSDTLEELTHYAKAIVSYGKKGRLFYEKNIWNPYGQVWENIDGGELTNEILIKD